MAEIELWMATASEGEPGAVERCCDRYLTAEDRQRAARFRQPTSRNQHVVGRGMTRRLIGGGAVDPESMPFDDEPGGKPRLVVAPERRATRFNVSHTPGMVLFGLVREGKATAAERQIVEAERQIVEADRQIADGVRWIGVDVERQDRRFDLAMAERYFSPPEIAQVQACASEAEARALFLKIWTLKESFIKAIGTGLRTPLADFAFDRLDSDQPVIQFLDAGLAQRSGGPPDRWRFRSLHPRSGYVAAVAALVDAGSAAANVSDGPRLSLNDFDALAAEEA